MFKLSLQFSRQIDADYDSYSVVLITKNLFS